MLKRGRIALVVVVLVVLVLAGLAGAGLYFSGSRELYSDPAMVRTNAIYAAAYAEPKERPAMPEGFFDQFQFQQSSNEIIVTAPVQLGGQSGGQPGGYGPVGTIEADGSHTARIGEGGGTVRLAFVGTVHSVPLRTRAGGAAMARRLRSGGQVLNWAGIEPPFRLFGADMSPATEEDIQQLLPGHRATFRMMAHYPAARFYFAQSNTPALKPTSLQVFDGRTKWPLSTSASKEEFEGGFWFDAPIHAWRQTPLEVVVTVMAGPLEETTVKVEPGAKLKFGGGQIRVAAVSANVLNSMKSMGSNQEGRTEVLSLKAAGPHRPENRAGCTVVLQAWPSGPLFPGEIRFLDADGNEIKRRGSGRAGNRMVFELPTEVENVHSLRVRHYPRTERLIFRLPELPGLPEENREVKNLFDVRVPYALFIDEYQLQKDLKAWLQMDGRHFALNYPNGFFPLERTNVTVRELFLEMERMLPISHARLVPDMENHVIEMRKDPLKEKIRRLKMRIGL